LTDPAGDTARLLRKVGIDNIARLDSAEEIALALQRFLDQVKHGEAAMPGEAFVNEASRLHRTRELVDLLDRIPGPRAS
jgi:hypothetical protein